MVVAEQKMVEILAFCVPLMLISKAHVKTENTFTKTGVPDYCTLQNTQFNAPFGLRNRIITRHQTRFGLDHPDISIPNAKHIFC
jgi:hypothetical protein